MRMTSDDIADMKAMAADENVRVLGAPYHANRPAKVRKVVQDRDVLSEGARLALSVMKDGRYRTNEDVALAMRSQVNEVKCYLTVLRRLGFVEGERPKSCTIFTWRITDKGMAHQT